jgi:transcriptional regulator with XRE-family HTH domain
MSTNRERLGELIFTRRRELGLRQEDFEAMGGPAPLTVSSYEKGEIPEKPQRRTLSRFDAVLQWAEGSSASVLKGGDPTPLDTRARVVEARQRFAAAGAETAGSRWAVVDLDEVTAIATAAARISDGMEKTGGIPKALLEEIRDLRASSANLLVSAISSRESDEHMAALADRLEANKKNR